MVHWLTVYNLCLGLSWDIPFSMKPSLMPPKQSGASPHYHFQTTHLTKEIACLWPGSFWGQGSRGHTLFTPSTSRVLPCSSRPLASICCKNELFPLNKHVNTLGRMHFSHDLDFVTDATKGYEWTETLMAKLRIELKGPKMNKARLALKR